MCFLIMKYKIYNETNDDLIKEVKELNKFIKYVVKKEDIKDAYFNIIIVNNSDIKKLNKKYRNTDKETDVITFALEDEKEMKSKVRILGDIYISIDKVKEQSKLYDHSIRRELSFLALHGILHLLGYDHEEKEKEKTMFDKQEKLLEECNIRR